MPLHEEDYVKIISDLSKNVQEIKGFFGMKGEAPSTPEKTPERDKGRLPRLAFFRNNDGEPFVPARVMLQQFFSVESLPSDGDVRGGIEQIKPQMVFVDLSSEHRTDKISATLKAYRSMTANPLIFLLSRKVSKETEEKSARIGMFFLSSPLCPEEMADRLTKMSLGG
jgi:hypothetical protein